jgi:hypothetical protein
MSKHLIYSAILFTLISITIAGCSETVSIEDFNNTVAELSEKNDQLVNLQAELADLQDDYLDLEDALTVLNQETGDLKIQVVFLRKQIEVNNNYIAVADALLSGPPAGSTESEISLHIDDVWNLVEATNDETLRENYFDYLVGSKTLNEILEYIFNQFQENE